MTNPSPDLVALREAILCGDPSRAMPALVGLREVPVEQAVPLLLLGLEQSMFMVRSLSCAGLGVKQAPERPRQRMRSERPLSGNRGSAECGTQATRNGGRDGDGRRTVAR
jgi:hypothetical protein